jgi:glycosyltransferase involved in cell wall biosynthesis
MTAYVGEVDLTDVEAETIHIGNHTEALILVKWHQKPLGSVRVAAPAGHLARSEVLKAVAANAALSWRTTEETLREWLMQRAPQRAAQHPSWTVVVCTRDHVEDLRRCLDALMRIATPRGEIVVVDNAPSNDETAQLVGQYPVRYVREDRPGLNWARNRGALEASGDIVLYTDDDAIVDSSWVDAILEPFAEPRVGAVTGLTMPFELETPSQEMFEQYGGHGRGYTRREFDWTTLPPAAAGNVGAGVNMAIRRSLLNDMRLFECEMDAGTVTRTGGDNYAFYLLLAAGHKIVYTPDALVWHKHRESDEKLRSTLKGYSVGATAALTRCFVEHGDWEAISVLLKWVRHDHMRKLKATLLRRPTAFPRRLVFDYIAGLLIGPWAYFQARHRERRWRAAEVATTIQEVGHE